MGGVGGGLNGVVSPPPALSLPSWPPPHFPIGASLTSYMVVRWGLYGERGIGMELIRGEGWNNRGIKE